MSDSENALDYAEGWRPTEGDVLVGHVTEIAVGYSQWGQYPILTVRDESSDELVAVHAFHTALSNRLRQLKPRLGERIGIQYKGQRPHQTNPRQTVHVYIVRVHGRDGSDVWQALDAEAMPAQAAQAPAEPAQPQQGSLVNAEDFAPNPRSAVHDDDDIPF